MNNLEEYALVSDLHRAEHEIEDTKSDLVVNVYDGKVTALALTSKGNKFLSGYVTGYRDHTEITISPDQIYDISDCVKHRTLKVKMNRLEI